ncbi:MAG: hypothetical protein AAFN93_23335 [Bacteroidota bacterium]
MNTTKILVIAIVLITVSCSEKKVEERNSVEEDPILTSVASKQSDEGEKEISDSLSEDNSKKVKNRKPLGEQLWKLAAKCNDAISDPMFEEHYYDTLIDDSNNGYLHIAGSWPACGCACKSTVGGYKKNDGSYTLLKYEEWSCSTNYQTTSSENLLNILPTDFGLGMFANDDHEPVELGEISYFYIELEIPQHGTETILHLKLIPFGMINKCTGGICTGTLVGNENQQYLSEIVELSEEIESDDILMQLVNSEFDELDDATENLLKSFFENEYKDYTKEEFEQDLQRLYYAYTAYTELAYNSIIMDWDKQIGRFYLKEKKEAIRYTSFLQFLRQGRFYSPSC